MRAGESGMSNNLFMKALSKTESIYWHDSGRLCEIDEAISNGAVSVTLNPFLTYSALEANLSMWKEKASEIVGKYAGDKRAEELTKLVVGHYADKLKPFYDGGKPGEGLVCAQVDPGKCGNAESMINQGISYASIAPNVCVKLPATKAGLIACEELSAHGYNVVMTVGMTVPQALCSGETIKKGHERAVKNGIKPGFGAAVIMVGRLDDYLRDVAQDSGLEIAEEDITLAGVACFKRAAELFCERDYDAYLMAAAFRGIGQVKELAGSAAMLSVAPKIAKLLADTEMTEDISRRTVPDEVIKRLCVIKEFDRAYQPYGMKPEEFITFGAVNRTISQFVESGWNKMKAFNC